MPPSARHLADYEAPIVGGRAQPSARASALMLESQSLSARAWLLSDDGSSRARLPLIAGGSVTCDPTATVRRTASVQVLADWPDATSPLAYGGRVCLQRGIRVAVDAVEWITLMTGAIWEPEQSDEGPGFGPLSVPLKDEMATIAADGFDSNTTTDTTLTVIAQLTTWIRRSLPAATIIDLSGPAGQLPVGKLDVQKDPAAGLMKVAASAGLEVYCGRGFCEFVIAPVPTLDDPPRWTVAYGSNLMSTKRKRTRPTNRIIVVGDTNDATAGGTTTPPPSGEARIDDPTDPCRYGGPAGRNTKTITMPAVKDNAQATIAAQAWIQRVRGAGLDTSFTSLVNPALDGGDVVVSRQRDRITRLHITDAVTLPLRDTSALQDIATRGVELPDAS